MTEKCGNCRFARRDWLDQDNERAELFCHRHAPTRTIIGGHFLISPMSAFQDDSGHIDRDAFCEMGEPMHAKWLVYAAHDPVDQSGLWPLVIADEWCGEWQAGSIYTKRGDE